MQKYQDDRTMCQKVEDVVDRVVEFTGDFLVITSHVIGWGVLAVLFSIGVCSMLGLFK